MTDEDDTLDRWEGLEPEWDREWLNGPMADALKRDMLRVDADFAIRWLDTMAELTAAPFHLGEFTNARMDALRAWEKARKREQKALHYRYDPRRRSRRLIERDTALALTPDQLDAKLADVRARLRSAAEKLPALRSDRR